MIVKTEHIASRRIFSVHFEKDEDGTLSPLPGDEDGQELEDQLVQSPLPAKSVEENMRDVVNMKARNLDQWCFAEHLEPTVFLQVLHS